MQEKYNVKYEQANALNDLEIEISKPIPLVKKVKNNTFGIKVEGDNVIALGLYKCGLKTLPESIGNLKSLEILNLEWNKLSTLPKSIGNLKSLQILDLNRNQLSALPESIGNLKSLQILDLNRNQLSTLPKSIGNLKSLQTLYLEVNLLLALPESIGDLKSLKTLNLRWNKSMTLPKSIGNIKSLETLYLSFNELSTLPESIGNLSSLKELRLHNNHLLTLPESIIKLQSLQTLDLENNELSTLPESIGDLKLLQRLYLIKNHILALPKSIADLSSLQTLLLGNNELSTLPESITKLQSLQTLDLENNELSTLPKSIGNLKSLQTLYLKGNQLTNLPESISNLSSLKKLYLSNNELLNLPESIGELKSLQYLSLDYNHFEGVDEFWSRIFTHAQQIVEYCQRKKRGEPEFIEYYDINKSYDENIKKFKDELKEKDDFDFVNIGTNRENLQYKWKQNRVFFEQIPIKKNLIKIQNNLIDTDLEGENFEERFIHSIQLHSLKGIRPPKADKVKHFKFFIKNFWDENEISNNGILVYNELESRAINKIAEMLDLSIKFKENKPCLIVFPENSIPCISLKYLQDLSKKENLIIIGGLEHLKPNESVKCINLAIIIDNGKIGYQVKQTPVWIEDKDKTEEADRFLKEKIYCKTFPKIKVFETTIGNIAIFICKDFLRLSEIIPDWAKKYQVDFIIIPSLSNKVLPFHSKLLNILNYTKNKELKIIFNNIGEYGGSEFFSINSAPRIETSYRVKAQDNIGEKIVVRKLKVPDRALFLKIITILRTYKKYKSDKEKERYFVRKFGILLGKGREILERNGFKIINNGDTISSDLFQIRLRRGYQTMDVHHFLIMELLRGQIKTSDNLYLSNGYAKSTKEKLGSNIKVLNDFISYLRKIP